MAEAFVKGDFLAKRGVPYIDRTGDLCPTNVGGMKVPFVFKKRTATTLAATAIPMLGNITVTKVIMPKAGSLIGISVYNQTKPTAASHATVTAYIGATPSTTLKVAWSSLLNTHGGYVMQNKDVDVFAAGQTIRCFLANKTATGTTVIAHIFAEF